MAMNSNNLLSVEIFVPRETIQTEIDFLFEVLKSTVVSLKALYRYGQNNKNLSITIT